MEIQTSRYDKLNVNRFLKTLNYRESDWLPEKTNSRQ